MPTCCFISLTSYLKWRDRQGSQSLSHSPAACSHQSMHCYNVLLFVLLFYIHSECQLLETWDTLAETAPLVLIECPATRLQSWSCIPMEQCKAQFPTTDVPYCHWEDFKPYICCPQQRSIQVHTQRQSNGEKECGVLYSPKKRGAYLPNDQVLGAAIGGVPLRTATRSPWMVAIGERLRNGSIDWYCGGSLVYPHVVVTAAHCAAHRSADLVRVGELDFSRSDEDGADPVNIPVASVHVHPGYKPPRFYNDIGVLKLARAAPYNRFIRPICLPEQGEHQSFEDATAVLTGWGHLSYGGVKSDVLQEVGVRVFNNTHCTRAYASRLIPQHNFPEGIIKTQLCAGDPQGGKDACQGDSGGPLVLKDKGAYILIGIISAGVGCGSKTFPGVYTRVSSYVDWINRLR